MSGVGKAACDEDGLGACTVMIDCSSHGGETPFPLRGWGAMIEECNVKKNEGVMVCARVELQALLQGFKLVCNAVQVLQARSRRQVSDRDHKSDVRYGSSASLVLCRASRATCRSRRV
jgi:hypothetical protein